MAIRDIFRVNFSTFVNPKAWLGWDTIKQQTLLVIALFRAIFIPSPAANQESFEEAQKRFNLKEVEVEQIGKTYFQYALLFMAAGFLGLILAIYLLISAGTFAGFILAISFSAYLFAQAFRNHFWYFQIKNRKLGCTYEEWWQGKVQQGQPPKDQNDQKGSPP